MFWQALLAGRRSLRSPARLAECNMKVSVGFRARLHTLPLSHPSVCIWGANTGLGKTLFSAGLAAACARAEVETLYLKPVQTGFPLSSDAQLVASASGGAFATGTHAAALLPDGPAASSSSGATSSISGRSSTVLAKTLYAWRDAVSPHLAVQREGRPVSDAEIVSALAAEAGSFAASALTSNAQRQQQLVMVETAGGVASPGPGGTLQCDLLRPLRLPGLLVGDGRLGGISATLSALDTLLLRGYDVPLIVMMEDGQTNQRAIQQHVGSRARVLAFPLCSEPPADAPAAAAAAQQQAEASADGLPPLDSSLAAWLGSTQPQFDRLLAALQEHHKRRMAALQAAAAAGREALWWPFTQHGNVRGNEAVTVIDGRAGESFAVFRSGGVNPSSPTTPNSSNRSATSNTSSSTSSTTGPHLEMQYDACASWWTQGVSSQAQPRLVAAVSQAAGRYGHVMFPENVHSPALELAQRLLAGVGKGWAGRVFYSDNGSTAIEVALKMAFRKYMSDHNLLQPDSTCKLHVLGLQEGYHGDTLGAMDAVAPSAYNGRLQTPWYSGRGLFLDPPTAGIVQGRWQITMPGGMLRQQPPSSLPSGGAGAAGAEFGSRDELFDLESRDNSALADAYRQHIEGRLREHAREHSDTRLGACILEPVLQGAGGMRLIDPLFQRVLVQTCRQQRIPVIFDEVFTGFWRLGQRSGADMLGIHPDIACYAKLLTGGLVPLAATLARPEVFLAFQSDSKLHALLHGHSYTAHAIGCAAGVEALQLLADPQLNTNVCTPEGGGSRCSRCSGGHSACTQPCGRLRPLWCEQAVTRLSEHPAVQKAMALGTVLALELRAEGPGGYASSAAQHVVARLRKAGVYARPLGNVVYLMVTPMTDPQQCKVLLERLEAAL